MKSLRDLKEQSELAGPRQGGDGGHVGGLESAHPRLDAGPIPETPPIPKNGSNYTPHELTKVVRSAPAHFCCGVGVPLLPTQTPD